MINNSGDIELQFVHAILLKIGMTFQSKKGNNENKLKTENLALNDYSNTTR